MIRNLTLGRSDMTCARTDRISEVDSSSLHSSRVSITIVVEMVDSLSGSTINSSI